jgi:hypothetical protein
MRAIGLRLFARQCPKPLRPVELAPGHFADFGTALACNQHEPEGTPEDSEGAASLPNGADFQIGQDAIALDFLGRPFHGRGWGCFDQLLINGPGKKRLELGEDPVCSYGRILAKRPDNLIHVGSPYLGNWTMAPTFDNMLFDRSANAGAGPKRR